MNESMLAHIKSRFQYDHESGEIRSKRWLNVDGKFPPVGHKNKSGYIDVCTMGKTIKAHRVAWFLAHDVWPSSRLDIDHINGIRDDNRLVNLRLVSRSVNLQNRKATSSKKTNKLLGAYFVASPKDRPWRAAMKVMGKTMSIGQFATEEEAHQAYLDAKRIYHPGFVP